MYNDYEDEAYNTINTSSVVSSLPSIGKRKEDTTSSNGSNGSHLKGIYNSNNTLPESLHSSSNPTPELKSMNSMNIISNSNGSNENSDDYDALLGFLSGNYKPTEIQSNDTISITTSVDEKFEQIQEKQEQIIEIIDENQQDIQIKEEEISFKDEIIWNRNNEDTTFIDEFLKNRIFDSFKNNILKPRNHQLKTIQSILKDIINPKFNQSFKSDNRYNYLIQHAAGSGKSLTIAMLVYFLYKIEVNNKLKYDTIVIMNDRTQLDAQLGDIIIKFLRGNGITNYCRPKSSKELQKEITIGKNRIIITTMQKFAQLLPGIPKNKQSTSIEDDFAFKYNNVAIISDEAHRSHGKSTTEKLHNFLNGNTRQPGLITYFSFTCTPTVQCLEMFGIANNGNRVPFNTYSMAEAQKDHLVLDVVGNIKYPYSNGYGVNTIDEFSVYNFNEDDLYYYDDEREIKRGRSRIDADVSDMNMIVEKSKFIVKHIIDNKKIFDKDSFKSRAMFVCNGRRNLFVYKKTIDDIIQSLPPSERFDTIAAFSPLSVDGKNILESDVSINGKYAHFGNDKMRGITRALIEDQKNFKIRLILVADKLQTGFDEPSLCLMYIDKKIKGANAVQTLSRLSRTAKDKTSTLVIDFVNNEKEIKQVFQLYKNSTTLRDLQDTTTLAQALVVASNEIQNAFINERNINSFCKAIIYHEENKTEQYKKYKGLEYSIETFSEVYRILANRNSDIPILSIQPSMVEKIKKSLYSLRQEKNKEKSKIMDQVKIKIDYLTDEESKKYDQFNILNVDYDAEFAAKLWAEDSTSSKAIDPIYQMTKKLDEFQKSTSLNGQNSLTNNHNSKNNNSSNNNNNINNNIGGNKFKFDIGLVDPQLDYKNTSYQTNFSKPIPNPNDYLKNLKNPQIQPNSKPAPFIKKDLWSSAGQNLGKRPTTTYPKLSPNLVQPNKKLQLEQNNNN